MVRALFSAIVTCFVCALFSSVVFAAAQEQRCTDLGSVCVCSEPLDFADEDFSSCGGSCDIDFSDSEGGGAKECGGESSGDPVGPVLKYVSGQGLKYPDAVSASSTGLPGNGTTNVLQINLNSSWWFHDKARTFTDGTWCQRHYYKVSSGFNDSTYDFKGPRNSDQTATPGFQTATGTSGYFIYSPGYPSTPFCSATPCEGVGGPSFQFLNTPPYVDNNHITWADCEDSWCRMEICYDHNEDTQQKLRWRARVMDLSNPGVYTGINHLSNLTNSTVDSGAHSRIAGTVITVTPPSDIEGQSFWLSHGMVAIKQPADPTFWIGPASEIEGSASTGGTLVGGSISGGSIK